MDKHETTHHEIQCIHAPNEPVASILCLGYDTTQTRIINALIQAHCCVSHTAHPLTNTLISARDYDVVVSFGYRYILSNPLIAKFNCPIINLHMSYLPFNRGAHPNFWSFYDDTPKGVTIHLIEDNGIDTGPILWQRKIDFPTHLTTFAQTYDYLIDEVETLFIKYLPNILQKQWDAAAQPALACEPAHRSADLPLEFAGWRSVIASEIPRLKQLLLNKQQHNQQDN